MKASDIPGGPHAGKILCGIAEIEDGKAVEFTCRLGDELFEFFIQRQGDEVYAYENSCPHVGSRLNLKEGQFTEKSGKYFMCHTHGALFDIATGKCLAGPCNGQSLRAIDIENIEGTIIAR